MFSDSRNFLEMQKFLCLNLIKQNLRVSNWRILSRRWSTCFLKKVSYFLPKFLIFSFGICELFLKHFVFFDFQVELFLN